jgi:hypothetical protein
LNRYGPTTSSAVSKHRVLLAVAACLLGALVLVPDAQAGKTADSFVGGAWPTPQAAPEKVPGATFLRPRDIAVDESTGDVFVADALGGDSVNNVNRIQRLSAEGAFELAWAWDVTLDGSEEFEICTVAAQCKRGAFPGDEPGQFYNPTGIAIDQSDPALDGDPSVYVLDRENRRIQKFDADGNFILMLGDGVNETTGSDRCTAASEDDCGAGAAGSGAGQFFSGDGFSDIPKLDVHQPSGELFVADNGNRRIAHVDPDAADPNGVFLRAWGWDVIPGGADEFEICTAETGCQAGQSAGESANGSFGSNHPREVAVDAAGAVYAADSNDNRVLRFDSSEEDADELLEPPLLSEGEGGPLLDGDTAGIEVDPTTGNLFIARAPSGGEALIQEIDTETDGEVPASPHGVGDELLGFKPIDGIGINGSTGDLYVGYRADSDVFDACPASACSGVFIFDDDGPGPDPTPLPVTANEVDAHEATLQATIEPHGAAAYRFQYTASAGEDAWVDASDLLAVAGSGPVVVSAPLTGLEANRLYRTRVIARKIFSPNASVTVTSSETSFSTLEAQPEVTTGVVRQVSDTSAYITGQVNANNLPTEYQFQWGLTEAHGNVVPIPAGQLEGGKPQLVGEQLVGLVPETTYHYRIVAENDKGEAEPQGVDRTFTTREAIEPPPGRAYEMVTPPDKVNRRAGHNAADEAWIARPGVVGADGDSYLFDIFAAILDPQAGTVFPHANESSVIRRDEAQGRWRGEGVVNLPSLAPAAGVATSVQMAVSVDGDVQAWQHNIAMFESGSHLSTKVAADVGSGGHLDSGWYEWITDPVIAERNDRNADDALIDDEGERMLRWGTYLGLLGPDDPSLDQLPPTPPGCNGRTVTCEFPGGNAIYIQEPPGSGPRHFVNECTDTSGPTQIPARLPGGAVGARDCHAGSPTSVRGAVPGGGATLTAWHAGTFRAMSNDGKRVFFTSTCSGDTGEPTDCEQLFVRQYDSSAPGSTSTATVRWISRPQVSAQQDSSLLRPVHYEGASVDGRYVFFRTDAPLTDDDPNGGESITAGPASPNSWDLYRYELPPGADEIHGTEDDVDGDPAGGELTRLTGGETGSADPSTSSANTHGDGKATRFISTEGSRVYFVTRGKIDDAYADNTPPKGSSATNLAIGTATTPGLDRNLYLYDEDKSGAERWKFVARLPRDCAGGLINHASSQPGQLIPAPDACYDGTDDGEVLLFATDGRLTEDDDDDAGDLYVYDAAADELIRASAPQLGQAPYLCGTSPEVFCNADLGFDPGAALTFPAFGLDVSNRNYVTRDPEGTVSIFFQSRLQLIPEDSNGDYFDVYRWRNGRLDLISPGDTPDHSWYMGSSIDGEDVFFQTTLRIDPREIEDADLDVYDARVGGGFPPPALLPTPCAVLSGACTPAPSAPPPPASSSSAGFRGEGNLTKGGKAPRCAKGKVRRKGRCARCAKGKVRRKGRCARCAKGKVRRKGRCVKRKARAKRHGKQRTGGRR